MRTNHPILILILLVLAIFSCEKTDNAPEYTIPETYNFENVNYDGQLQRLAMFTEMKSYMATARTTGVTLDANKLKAMYANDAANAGWQGTYDASKQLKGKTFSSEQAVFDALLEELADASKSVVSGSAGTAGVVVSLDGNSKYLLGGDGLDHAQIVEKGLMGACFYYQATSVYLGADRMNVDNETIEPGEGTAMEHHWDECFGYLGAPIDFPTNTDGLLYWGRYSNLRDAVIGCNQPLMDALLKGRAAISNKDLNTRDEAIAEVRQWWESIAVASALHYLNESVENFDDIALRGHALSEGIGFLYSLKFNEERGLTEAEINTMLTKIAGASTFDQMDAYNTTVAKLEEVRDELAATYGWSDKKDEF